MAFRMYDATLITSPSGFDGGVSLSPSGMISDMEVSPVMLAMHSSAGDSYDCEPPPTLAFYLSFMSNHFRFTSDMVLVTPETVLTTLVTSPRPWLCLPATPLLTNENIMCFLTQLHLVWFRSLLQKNPFFSLSHYISLYGGH